MKSTHRLVVLLMCLSAHSVFAQYVSTNYVGFFEVSKSRHAATLTRSFSAVSHTVGVYVPATATNWVYSYAMDQAPPGGESIAVMQVNHPTLGASLIPRKSTNLFQGLSWSRTGTIGRVQVEYGMPYCWIPNDSQVLTNGFYSTLFGSGHKPVYFVAKDYAVRLQSVTNHGPVRSVLFRSDTNDFDLTLTGTEAGNEYYIISKSNPTNALWQQELVVPVAQSGTTSGIIKRQGRHQLTLCVIRDDADIDRDGTPDWWMEEQFGHAAGWLADNSHASLSANTNEISNLAAFQRGLNPHGPIEVIRIFLPRGSVK